MEIKQKIIDALKFSIEKVEPDISSIEVTKNLDQTFGDIGIDSLDSVAIILITLKKLGIKEDIRCYSKNDKIDKIVKTMEEEANKSF